MLVLTRRIGESLIIDDKIEIKPLKINGNQVRIGIIAPRDISVYRIEVYDKSTSGKVLDIISENNNS